MLDDKSETIHVTCAADAGYGPYAGIALSSVLDSNAGSKICIHLFSDGIKRKDVSRVERLARNHGAGLVVYDVQEKLNSHPTLRAHAHYSRASYVRLFIPDFISSEVDWVVYIDCDIVCVSTWRDIWAKREEISVIGAAVDPWVDKDSAYKESLGIPPEQTYYGAGVLLINLKAWRNRRLGHKLLEYVQRGPTQYIDQDAINCTLGKEITELPASWNALVSSPYYTDMSGDMERAINIHFCSSLKPWHLGYRLLRGTGAKAFAEAKARSPWRWLPPDPQIRRLQRKLLRR